MHAALPLSLTSAPSFVRDSLRRTLENPPPSKEIVRLPADTLRDAFSLRPGADVVDIYGLVAAPPDTAKRSVSAPGACVCWDTRSAV